MKKDERNMKQEARDRTRIASCVMRCAQYALRNTIYSIRITSKGFTLIEIMIVVIILAALAAMVVPRLTGRSQQAKIAIAEADIKNNIAMPLKLYHLDNGSFPATEQGLTALKTKPSTDPVPENWNGPYLENDPIDPWKHPYQYKSPGTHNIDTYDLYSFGPDGVESEDDVKNWE